MYAVTGGPVAQQQRSQSRLLPPTSSSTPSRQPACSKLTHMRLHRRRTRRLRHPRLSKLRLPHLLERSKAAGRLDKAS